MILRSRRWAAISCTIFRFSVFVFLRWIPGHHFPPIIYTCFCIYAVSLYNSISSFSDPHSTFATQANGSARSRKNKTNGANGDVRRGGRQLAKVSLRDHVRTLLTGSPSSKSSILNAITFISNLCLLAFVVYYVYAPITLFRAEDLSFARVGYVSENSANILSRMPQDATFGVLSYHKSNEPSEAREDPNPSQTKPLDLHDRYKTDWTITITIPNLNPDTRYYFTISYSNDKKEAALSKQSGHFITAPKVGSFSKRGNGRFSFLHASCIIRNFPFKATAHPLSIHGFKHLATWLSKLRPSFMLFLGDFIYIDVPIRHGSDVETYRRQYRQVYASPDWPRVSRVLPDPSQPEGVASNSEYDLPWIHTYDDHEIANDWSGNTTGYFPSAFNPYLHYHLNPNAPLPGGPIRPTEGGHDARSPDSIPFSIPSEQATYSFFNQGPASFFILDTRRYRKPPTQHLNSTMLGESQLEALFRWIRDPVPPGVAWKILVSSVPFTRNWRVNAQDTWTGYTVERRKILEEMWDYGSQPNAAGIVVLSGDRHEFAATAFPPPHFTSIKSTDGHPATKSQAKPRWNAKSTVYEFSTSPLSQFYLPIKTYSQDKPSPRLSSNASVAALESQAEEDICIKYIPKGNSKFGLVEIEPSADSAMSLLRYRLFVNGEETWSYVLTPGETDLS